MLDAIFIMWLRILFLVMLLAGCVKRDVVKLSLFSNITTSSGITFSNQLAFTDKLNPYTYRNFYNGAGVAIGDINNDGLQDIYFAGNQTDNKLYLNRGNLQFEDITTKAGVACSEVWSTGVTFVDINADGLLDIYVCKSGNPEAQNRHNELFINNGNLTFTEKSKEYGLDVTGLSVQAAFFDYDRDGDLDCYLLTNSFKSIGNFDLVKDQRETPDSENAGNKFFVNENGKFKDYTSEARIYRSSIGFGLGITLGDFNEDDWTDIFVSNDFFERDYLYLNDQKGGFTESLTDYFQSISMGSMGADFADLDNDGVNELFVTEMLPDSLSRKKTKTVFENWNKYQLNLENGYHHQFSRNVLQKKIGKNNYAEIGRLGGVAATEWSWGALLFDMDNDGKRDIFVANGIYKDLLDRDYLTYTAADDNVRKIIREEKNAIVKLINLMPSSQFQNYALHNNGDMNFTNLANQWGLDAPMFSSGSAYGDLDNDGDLDLVVNNINSPSLLYRNNSDSSRCKSISISLKTESKNKFAVGAEVTVFSGSKIYTGDNFVTRGYQSAVQPIITIGLGTIQKIDSILIKWPDAGYSVIRNVSINRLISLVKEKTLLYQNRPFVRKEEVAAFDLIPISQTLFKHNSAGLNDFNRDRLLPMMYSNETPYLLKGDIDGDGKNEIYVGGGRDQSGLFVKYKSGGFSSSTNTAFGTYMISEETKGTLVDIDGDGDLDFYMAMGGRSFSGSSSALSDKLFLNDGKGNFIESANPLPFTEFIATSTVSAIDFDKDGDSDLVVGERFDPVIYGKGGRGFLFENDGKGAFKDVTKRYAPRLLNVGMITDIETQDIDGDGWKDLVIVGDWMPIIVLRNDKKQFVDVSESLGLKETYGWWHDIEAADLNKDGKVDFVVGNHGLNSFFKKGDRMYVNDFDGNGSVEQIFCTKGGDRYYPIVDKDEFLSQLPSFKKNLLYYRDYGKKAMEDLFSKPALDAAKVFEVDLLASVVLLSEGSTYVVRELPLEAQYSAIYALIIADVDNDGIEDVIAGGNQYQVKPQFGRNDASNGWLFKGSIKNGQFSFQSSIDLNVKGQIRDIEIVKNEGVTYILFAKNNDKLEIFKIPK